MGVPKFFKWLAERYPCIISPLHVPTMPTLDNLYLDMNGIIHNATHSNDKYEKGESETTQMLKIFEYIDKLFNMCRPQNYFYMAIDGVAPRAKMNQQRQRRFRSAHDTEVAIEKARDKGEDPLVLTDIFDSNCITPGTPFMERLSIHLEYFIRYKIQTDANWRKCKIIYSGHDVPGEGEHKIMDFIRARKMQKGYAPNQTHCIYGLDADLIMLALITHEPHFFLLREDVFEQYQYAKSQDKPIASSFQLLHLSILREYFDREFRDMDLGVEYDLERIIDDFVLICFFCGNDFIPHGPSLDIGHNAIATLFDIYKQTLPDVGGYLTEYGKIRFERLQPFIGRIAEMEPEIMDTKMKDRVQQMNKRRRGKKKIKLGIRKQKKVDNPPKALATPDFMEDMMGDNLEGEELEKQLAALERESENDVVDPLTALDLTAEGNKADPLMLTSDDVREIEDAEEDEENFLNDIATPSPTPQPKSKYGDSLIDAHDEHGNLDFEQWQKTYYKQKLGIDMEDKEAMLALQKSYIEGIMWVYEYYYNGCPSWKWFYPYAYSPLLSSVKNAKRIAKSLKKFDMGKPFTPFQQLLGVLPPKSSELLPEPYRALMCDQNSPVIDLYPKTIDIDREGTKYDYEGVVILPFMDEDRLLAAEEPLKSKLTKAEKRRNAFGQPTIYDYDKDISYNQKSSLDGLNDISDCHVRVTPYSHPEYEGRFIPRLIEGVNLGKNTLEGYPTFEANKVYDINLSNAGIRIFGHPSKKESMIIQLYDENEMLDDTNVLLAPYEHLIDQHVYIGYPFPRPAIVTSISCETHTNDGIKLTKHTPDQMKEFKREALKHQEVLKTRQGIDVGEVHVLIFCTLFQEMIVNKSGMVIPRYSSKDEEYGYPAQVLCPNYAPKKDKKFMSRVLKNDDTSVICLDPNYYGLPGHIESLAGKNKRQIRVDVNETPVPNLKSIAKLGNTKYQPLWLICKKLKHPAKTKVTSQQLGRIVGKFAVGAKTDNNFLGLKIRNAKSSKCLLGFAKVEITNQANDENYVLNRSTMVSRSSEFSTVSTTSNWVFSTKLINILQAYLTKFPEVFDAAGLDKKVIKPVDVFPTDTSKKLKEVKEFIETLGLKGIPNIHVSRQQFPNEIVEEMESEVEAFCEKYPKDDIQQKSARLYTSQFIMPSLTASSLDMKYSSDIDLGTRVVYARSFGSVPLGARGTVVGIQGTMAHVMFDRCFTGASNLRGLLKTLRGQSVAMEYLVNLSKPQFYAPPKASNKGFQKSFSNSPVYGSHYYSVQSFRQKKLPVASTSTHHSKKKKKEMLQPIVRQYEQYPKDPKIGWNNKKKNKSPAKHNNNKKKDKSSANKKKGQSPFKKSSKKGSQPKSKTIPPPSKTIPPQSKTIPPPSTKDTPPSAQQKKSKKPKKPKKIAQKSFDPKGAEEAASAPAPPPVLPNNIMQKEFQSKYHNLMHQVQNLQRMQHYLSQKQAEGTLLPNQQAPYQPEASKQPEAVKQPEGTTKQVPEAAKVDDKASPKGKPASKKKRSSFVPRNVRK